MKSRVSLKITIMKSHREDKSGVIWLMGLMVSDDATNLGLKSRQSKAL